MVGGLETARLQGSAMDSKSDRQYRENKYNIQQKRLSRFI